MTVKADNKKTTSTGQPAGRKYSKTAKNKVVNFHKCVTCGKEKRGENFYKSYSPLHKEGVLPTCKDCLKAMTMDDDNYIEVGKVKDVLRSIDKPYIHHLWRISIEEAISFEKKTGKTKQVFGVYIKNLSLNYSRYTWADSVFEDAKEYSENDDVAKPDGYQNTGQLKIKERMSEFERYELVAKWGQHKDEELVAFEKRYTELKNNYPEKTALHTEALRTYVLYKIKSELAIARNNADDSKKWGELAQKAATSAKINPSQLSKADLSDGLSTFSELTQAVEAEVNVIRILPQFKAQPNDIIDFNLWCYVNYVRHLKGLPECTY